MTKKFTLLQLFSLIDGRLSTSIDDVYEMLNHIMDDELMTHELPTAMSYLKTKNPKWFQELTENISNIKTILGTDDFEANIEYIKEGGYEFDIPQLKDEVDMSNLGSFIIDNSLLISKTQRRKIKLQKINKE